MNVRRAAGALAWALAAMTMAGGCSGSDTSEPAAAAGQTTRPSILLVTLDTTRADSIGPAAEGVETPSFDALAVRGRRFEQAYATVPETLPSHSSMMTGLYPAGHGVHENARFLSATHPVLAERLRQTGYRTAAFVSSFVLARRFGIARGFDVYDDELPADRAERTAKETTDRALAYLEQAPAQPLLLWVHYFDPHTPYTPPEPFLSTYAAKPYLGEIAAMDQQLGRLVPAFEQRVQGPTAIVIASDHGEGLGDHGESQHGNLVYQSTMHVPLVLVGPGIEPGVSDTPVSTRRIFHTVLDWAGLGSTGSLRSPAREVVLGEAMKPFLEYGWQPQTMAVDGRHKAILAGKLEVYDVIADPAEAQDLASSGDLPPAARKALEEYPLPSIEAARAPDNLSDEARRRLASLGYVGSTAPPVVRRDAPRPVDMVHLFDVIERASGLFVQERYADAVPLLEKILSEDSHNLDAALRLAAAHSALGQNDRAIAAFRKASLLAPGSPDVRTYLALHHARGKDWQQAVPLLEQIVATMPERLPAVEALARIRERQGRMGEALKLRQRVYTLREPTAAELIDLGRLAMVVQQTPLAIESFEKARTMQGGAFAHHLELGVVYLAARRYPEARESLDRVPSSHPEYPMALFKRAQVSVLLNEPDRAARIERARRHADATTRDLIAKERLFRSP
jgi:arylsulfatase A-like enzyme/Tfp pilus assembly protein PilF